MRERTKSCIFNDFILFDGCQVPVRIIVEKRSGSRCSFTQKFITIRVPSFCSKEENRLNVEASKNWALKTLKEKPTLLNMYVNKGFTDKSTIRTFDDCFTFHFKTTFNKKLMIQLKESEFFCSVPKHYGTLAVEKKHIASLLSKRYRPFFELKLNYWNQFFPVRYNAFRVKYNSSNWGSCSSKRNINLSIRLILCPEDVIDYVIVHELAHLIHQNHSIQFWKEVERVYPNYKESVKWLKTEGVKLDF